MSLPVGAHLGPYEILGPLGSGGMGEVYRARDAKLGRLVAIKVILDQFASDEERVGRFEREAKMLAALNHPRIAALYGMERVEGQHFLVMELIEGETLGDRLRRGPMQVEEALSIGAQDPLRPGQQGDSEGVGERRDAGAPRQPQSRGGAVRPGIAA